jgi:hypothetical protein
VKVPTKPWVEELQRELAGTEEHFRPLFPPNILPWPIPFFGQLFNADILTVGVNPSCGEFESNRWKDITKSSQAEERLLSYFKCKTRAHPWFETWENALNKIDASYYPNAKYLAAHIDLSPRVTLPMSRVDEELFIQMVINDLFSFIRFIDLATHTRILLMAGVVTGDYYLNEFLKEHLPVGSELKCGFNSSAQRGPAKIAYHWLKTRKQNLRAFFCSCSPSDCENRHLLIKRVEENIIPIRKLGRL